MLALVSGVLVSTLFAGSAFASDPILIANQTDLEAIAGDGSYQISESFGVGTPSNGAETYIQNTFTGTLDGAGKSISGLQKPLFDSLGPGAVVKDLTLNTNSLSGNTVLAKTAMGTTQNPVIIETVTVTGTVNSSEAHTGVLVATNNGDLQISNADSSATINSDRSSSTTGGLVGQNTETMTVTSSSNSGTINSQGGNTGGLVGQNTGTLEITNSYNAGLINASGNKVGGLVGVTSGETSIDLSFNSGNVSANSQVGGLVGSSQSTETLTILNSVSIGSVSGMSNVGGLVGNTGTTTIENSYAIGTTSGCPSSPCLLYGHRNNQEPITIDEKSKFDTSMTPVEAFSAAFEGQYADFESGKTWGTSCSTLNGGLPFLMDRFETNPCPYFTVTFNNGGHGNDIDPIYVSPGSGFNLPSINDPEFTFLNWLNPSGENVGGISSFYTPGGDTELTAIWTPKYKISFDLRGNSAAISDVYVDPGFGFTLSSPTSTEFVFQGWASTPELTSSDISNNCLIGYWYWETGWCPSGDTTLYAVWTPKYKISFDLNGHGDDISDFYINPGLGFYLPSPTSTEFTFLGWASTPEPTSSDISNNCLVGYWWWETGWCPSEDTTLYAVWTPKYKISFDLKGYGDAITDALTDPGSGISLPFPTELGFTFQGWASTPERTSSDVSNNCSSGWCPSGDTTLYALWTQSYKISFDLRGNSAAISDIYVDPGFGFYLPSPTSNEFTFQGWASSSELTSSNVSNDCYWGWCPSEDTTLYAVWTPKYKIAFDLRGHGADISDIYVDQGYGFTLPTPTSTEFTFLGWASTSELTSSDVSNNCSSEWCPSEDTTLYAVWTQSYKISFEVNEIGNPVSDLYIDTQYGGTLPSTSATGYIFVGWALTPEQNSSVISNNCGYGSAWCPSGDEKNITLYAMWTSRYKVSFNLKGHGSPVSDSYVTPGSGYGVNLSNLTENGFNFIGWTTIEDDQSEIVEEWVCESYYYNPWVGWVCSSWINVYFPSRDTELYAVWEQVSNRIQFHNDGPGANPDDKFLTTSSLVFGDLPWLDSDGTNKFLGWSYAENDSTQLVRNDVVPTSLNTELYAIWEEIIPPAPTFTVPSLIGISRSEAQGRLTSAGLTNFTATPVTSGANSSNNGLVISQTISSGTTLLDSNTLIGFTYFNYIAPIPQDDNDSLQKRREAAAERAAAEKAAADKAAQDAKTKSDKAAADKAASDAKAAADKAKEDKQVPSEDKVVEKKSGLLPIKENKFIAVPSATEKPKSVTVKSDSVAATTKAPVKITIPNIPKGVVVTTSMKLPNGQIIMIAKSKSDGKFTLPALSFKTPGTYTLLVKVGSKVKRIKVVIK